MRGHKHTPRGPKKRRLLKVEPGRLQAREDLLCEVTTHKHTPQVPKKRRLLKVEPSRLGWLQARDDLSCEVNSGRRWLRKQ